MIKTVYYTDDPLHIVYGSLVWWDPQYCAQLKVPPFQCIMKVVSDPSHSRKFSGSSSMNLGYNLPTYHLYTNGVKNSLISLTPAGPLQSFTVTPNIRNMTFSWSPPVSTMQHGMITGYAVLSNRHLHTGRFHTSHLLQLLHLCQ